MNSYINLNQKFWNREYFAPNVEEFIFRLKPILLNQYINFKKKRNLKFLILDVVKDQTLNTYLMPLILRHMVLILAIHQLKSVKKKIINLKIILKLLNHNQN